MAGADTNDSRLDSEWVTVNAVRELIRLATRGDYSKATYDHALELGAAICPELLGKGVSLLQHSREGQLAREYRQRAEAKARRLEEKISPLSLLDADILELRGLLNTAKGKQQTDQLKRRLKHLEVAREELDPASHSENQLIFRDAYGVDRQMPTPKAGRGFRDFLLPDENIMRLRVFHPDRPEHLSGADVIYERHEANSDAVSLVALQYKIWEDKRLPLGDPRMSKQIEKLRAFSCKANLCIGAENQNKFRFPFCAAFLRPTDRLQSADQKLISSGEHLPLCQIDSCSSSSNNGGKFLRYDDIRSISLSQDVFEHLFSRGKIGSRLLTYSELAELYEKFEVISEGERILIHAQDFSPLRAAGNK